MKCTNCGNEIVDEKAKFCPICGNIVKTKDLQNSMQKNKWYSLISNKYIIAIIIFIVVIFAGYTGYNKFYSKSDVQKSKSTTAKVSKQAKLNITQVNTDNFPLIKVYFSVLDEQNNLLSGLNTKYFKINERLGNNTYDSNTILSDVRLLNEDESINLNLVMDISDSMNGVKLQRAKNAANNFLNVVNYKVGDKIEIISFSDSVNISQPFTSDKNVLKSCIDKLNTFGGTAFYDSLYSALIETNKQSGHKCIIAFTDGQDNRSKYSKENIITLSKQLSIPIYIMGLGDDVQSENLIALSTATGGYYKAIFDINDMENIYKDIFKHQKSQYILMYTTKNSQVSNEWRNLEITLNGEDVEVKTNTQFIPKQAVNEELNKKEQKETVMRDMEKEVKNLILQEKGEYSVAYQDLKDNGKMYINSKKTRAASVIKIYIMIEAFDAIKQGRINGNEEIVLENYMKVAGTGILAGKPEGTRVSINDLIELMIAGSDNTAANILIDKLGMDNINKTITRVGCVDTYIQRKMMDAESMKQGKENYTSVNDLCLTLNKIYKNECLGKIYDEKMLEIMKKQKNNTKIPSSLPQNLQIAHKTGELEGVENDAAIVFCPQGDYLLCILTEGTLNATAIKNQGAISKIVYEYNQKKNK